ncbi:nicotinamide N-methyltransferase-like [Haliotis rubra]|uniref:nicotinamide N-methyltransferase-like n=1 Tax=Haliotis rubra TaxID=36100 RepID=UPI001EE52708|nr:nicotinamide N-methyltransferase-like [Haliotis rubra]
MADIEMFSCDDYTTHFEPLSYLHQMVAIKPQPGFESPLSSMLTKCHNAFDSGTIKGKTLLDIGTGPTIHTIISAAQHCDNIFLAKFCQSNRDFLKQWYDGSLKSSFDEVFEIVLKLEGKSKTDIPEREASIRDKIVRILHCDIRDKNTFSTNFLPKVDIITSSLCLEAAATDLASYEEYAGNMVGMLNPGGHLVIFGCLGGTFYTVGSKRFSSFGMSKDDLMSTWKKVGIEVISWEECSRPEKEYHDVDVFFGMVGWEKDPKHWDQRMMWIIDCFKNNSFND